MVNDPATALSLKDLLHPFHPSTRAYKRSGKNVPSRNGQLKRFPWNGILPATGDRLPENVSFSLLPPGPVMSVIDRIELIPCHHAEDCTMFPLPMIKDPLRRGTTTHGPVHSDTPVSGNDRDSSE